MYYDTLDQLFPIVTKTGKSAPNGNRNKLYKASYISRVSDLNNKLIKHINKTSQIVETVSRPSSSLFLDRISIINLKRQALKPHFTRKDNNKNPVIKITVLPIKEIKKTFSNKYICRHDKNIRLLYGPQEIHDLRETSSADLLTPRRDVRNIKYDKISLNHITYTKHILNSLNMNYKGRKEKRSLICDESPGSPRSDRKMKDTLEQACTCNNAVSNKVMDDMNSRKNRVTIVGRLGINEDDQYVLNCDATVDDKPIETRFIQQNSGYAPKERFEYKKENNKTTKSTQASMTLNFSSDMLKKCVKSNKIVQCNCKNATDVATNYSHCELGESKDCKSPLIVISVYPTKDTSKEVTCLGDLIQINQIQESPKNTATSTTRDFCNDLCNTRSLLDKQITKKSNTNIKRNVIKSPRSRSTSPNLKLIDKEKAEKSLMSRKNKKPVKRESPDRQPKLNKPSSSKKNSNRHPTILNTAVTSKRDPNKNRKEELNESNTDKKKIKKAIVDNYMQHILMSSDGRGASNITGRTGTKPKNDGSKVTINIDGDKERYRVLFLQDKLNTDLSVRKTVKQLNCRTLHDLKGNERIYNDDNFIENFLTLSNINQKQDDKPNKSETLVRTQSGFKIRDSLEICHRREEGQCRNKFQTTSKSKTKKSHGNDKDSCVKHYRGDSCSVPNPAERDQEIRELLGINKHRPGKLTISQDSVPQIIRQDLRHNAHYTKCVKNKSSAPHQCNCSFNIPTNTNNLNEQLKLNTVSIQCDQNVPYLCDQLTFNRNIQVFLQVENISKRKPIILSRKQYDKVKKTITKRVINRVNQIRDTQINTNHVSVVSIGEIREARKEQLRNAKIDKTVQVKEYYSVHENKLVQSNQECVQEDNKPLHLLYSIENNNKDEENLYASPRQTVSSMDIRYATTTHMKHVTFSSNNLKNVGPASPLCNFVKTDCPSVQTIFKGYKRSNTPNLGTSACSIYSEAEYHPYKINYTFSRNEKAKKPFLRRLMSCLVMRSAKMSEAILQPAPPCEGGSLMSSFDSYHINTSLLPMDMTSSLYDTSASFFTSHHVEPIARMKRGFFSSVRGFLTNLKAR